MLQVIEDCCSLYYLEMMKHAVVSSSSWNMKYPQGKPFEDKHLKLDIIDNEVKEPLLAGLAMGTRKLTDAVRFFRIRAAELLDVVVGQLHFALTLYVPGQRCSVTIPARNISCDDNDSSKNRAFVYNHW